MTVAFATLSAFLAAATALGQAPRLPDHPGPWDNNLLLLVSEDGFRFERQRTLVERGGVASLIHDRQGRLVAAFQWFPAERPEAFDRVAVSVSTDGGEIWSAPEPIVLDGLPSGHQRPFDPTLTLPPTGGYRLYFTSHAARAGDGPGTARGEPAIYSALSDDARRYRFEPGVRFQVEGEKVIDCAAAWLRDACHLFAPIQGKPGKGYHAVSRDGLEFERLPDVELEVQGSWLGCVLAVDGGLRFFGTGEGGWSATSSDGRSWRLDREGEAPVARYAGADPGVARLPSGRYLMVATGPPRERRGRREPLPPLGERPRLEGTTVAANEHSVYVLRDGVLHRFDANTLELKASVRLPDDGGRVPWPEDGAPRRPPPLPKEAGKASEQ